jgi:hypothetical protein
MEAGSKAGWLRRDAAASWLQRKAWWRLHPGQEMAAAYGKKAW